MIKVTVDRTEYDEDTLEVLSVAHETYTGECARKWLKEHPEAYDDNNMYEDYNNKSYSITDWYAKIGKRDVYDSEGNMKWDTKDEAEKAAKWFLEEKLVKKSKA